MIGIIEEGLGIETDKWAASELLCMVSFMP